MAISFKENECKIIGYTHISDIASLFYPDTADKRQAVRKLRRVISKNEILMTQLKRTGHKLKDEDLSPRQQKIIINNLGNAIVSFKMDFDKTKNESKNERKDKSTDKTKNKTKDRPKNRSKDKSEDKTKDISTAKLPKDSKKSSDPKKIQRLK